MKKRVTARGIVIKKDTILLMERWRGQLHYFSVPGGGVEPGETLAATVRREIREETGLSVYLEHEVITLNTEDSEHHIFLCTYESGEPHLPSDSPEAIRMLHEDNRFKPGWQPVGLVAQLPFEYWQPIQRTLVDMLNNGFPEKPVILTIEKRSFA